MSKRTTTYNNFRGRSASHSMTGKATGYSDILPIWAEIKDHCPNGIESQKLILSNEVSELKQKNQKRRLTKQEKNRLNSLKGQIGNINKTLACESSSYYEELKAWLFWRIAQHRLKHDAFRKIDIEAESIMIKILAKTPNKKMQPTQKAAAHHHVESEVIMTDVININGGEYENLELPKLLKEINEEFGEDAPFSISHNSLHIRVKNKTVSVSIPSVIGVAAKGL